MLILLVTRKEISLDKMIYERNYKDSLGRLERDKIAKIKRSSVKGKEFSFRECFRYENI